MDWAQISVGVAAVLGLIYTARTMRRVVHDVLTFLGNHLSAVTEAQREVAINLERLADRIDRQLVESARRRRQS